MPFALTYAGVGFRLPSRRIRDRLRRFETLENLRDVGERGYAWPGSKLTMLGPPLPLGYPKPAIGDFFYPVGASRWSIFRGIAGPADVAAMQAKAWGQYGPTPQPFVMQCGPAAGQPAGVPIAGQPAAAGQIITTNLYLLPPIPIGGPPGSPALYEVTLVDERYFWHQWRDAGPIDCTADTSTDTWPHLLDALAGQLGITLTYANTSTNYGTPEPDSALYSNSESAAVLLDTAAANVGAVVVRNLDGTYQLQRYAAALTAQSNNRPPENNLLGGLAVAEAGAALVAMLPESVTVVFPAWLTGSGYVEPTTYRGWVKDSYGQTYSSTVTLSSLGVGYGNLPSFPGSKILHTTAKALYSALPGTPTNLTQLQALAKQLATDYYDGRMAWLNETYAGAYPWTPEGVSDLCYCWRGKAGGVWTRATSPPFNAGMSEFQHGLGVESPPTPGASTITVSDSYAAAGTGYVDHVYTIDDLKLGWTTVYQTRGGLTADTFPAFAGYNSAGSIRGNVSTGGNQVTNVNSVLDISPGIEVQGSAYFPAGTFVVSATRGSSGSPTVYMSQAATATGTGVTLNLFRPGTDVSGTGFLANLGDYFGSGVISSMPEAGIYPPVQWLGSGIKAIGDGLLFATPSAVANNNGTALGLFPGALGPFANTGLIRSISVCQVDAEGQPTNLLPAPAEWGSFVAQNLCATTDDTTTGTFGLVTVTATANLPGGGPSGSCGGISGNYTTGGTNYNGGSLVFVSAPQMTTATPTWPLYSPISPPINYAWTLTTQMMAHNYGTFIQDTSNPTQSKPVPGASGTDGAGSVFAQGICISVGSGGGGGLTIGTTPIAGGTSGSFLSNTGGILSETPPGLTGTFQ